MATMLKVMFKIKSGIELFREKRLPKEELFVNKLGYRVRSRVAVLKGLDMTCTDDLKNELAKPLDSKLEALGYSDFILKWQNYFENIPYVAVLFPLGRDLRAEEEENTQDQARLEKLSEILHKTVHHANINDEGDHYTFNRTLGIAKKRDDGLYAEIWTTKETIQKDGSYKIDLLELLFEEQATGDKFEGLPRWFPRR